MMMKGLMLADESLSNLTSASGEVSASSSGTRINETGTNMYPSQQSFASTNQAPQPPQKKRRSLPGNPDPDAEVIALSPKSLLATNRFICEICNKGFQRDQNLQLHRRGHNLPWKLKQRTNKEVVRKKVYVCPETTCVHHDPSRALGDLTGIKKHFCRKHGEKKWKCEKCSKRYAVQSDWKAHSKICGTREYRCDCGTLFSRRDSFITHRAFCDALAEESARAITAPNPLQQSASATSHFLNLQPQQQQLLQSIKREQEQRHPHNSIPPWLASCPPPIDLSSPLYTQHDQNPSLNNPSSTALLPPFQAPAASPHMSATALLQKAAQMGVTMSSNNRTSSTSAAAAMLIRPHQQHHQAHMSESTTAAGNSAGLGMSSCEEMASGFVHCLASFGNKAAATAVSSAGFIEQVAANSTTTTLVHDMMSSLSPASGAFDGSSSSFDEALNGMLNPKRGSSLQETATESHHHHQLSRNGGERRGGNDGLTRDFLGLKAFPHSHREFVNVAGLDLMNSSSRYEQQNQRQTPWQG